MAKADIIQPKFEASPKPIKKAINSIPSGALYNEKDWETRYTYPEVRREWSKNSEKIHAIRALREVYHNTLKSQPGETLGLKEAKELVEAMMAADIEWVTYTHN